MFMDGGGETSLAFFAAVSASFALSLQCSPPPLTPSSPPNSYPTPSTLLALSSHTLSISEYSTPYTLDFLHALILSSLTLLHAPEPRTHQAVFAMVGKMVNIARLMGLQFDPEEVGNTSDSGSGAGRWSLWEKEMRRRVWWEVFYYDLCAFSYFLPRLLILGTP